MFQIWGSDMVLIQKKNLLEHRKIMSFLVCLESFACQKAKFMKREKLSSSLRTKIKTNGIAESLCTWSWICSWLESIKHGNVMKKNDRIFKYKESLLKLSRSHPISPRNIKNMEQIFKYGKIIS